VWGSGDCIGFWYIPWQQPPQRHFVLMQMMFNIRRQAMERRIELCAQPGATCPPMTWTISNRLAEFGPHLLQWYFR